MAETKYFFACIWGVAAFCLLCYGAFYRSANMLLLFAALSPSLVVFLWWMIDRSALERRLKRLEARFDIAAEKRVVMQADLTEVEHRLENVTTKIAYTEKAKARA
jgi:hypothetical protein